MIEEVDPVPAAPLSAPPAERNLVPEADFLFHLYRGSELLHDNRLLEAQSELEYALSLEPSDARTQGLLAVVYFRSGFYARAVTTYRSLLEHDPNDPTLRLNLALCYLKTGQSQGARVELEALVMEDVGDVRAWGYLALALERLGYVDQACEAFARAGQPDLARRMVEHRGASKPRTQRGFELSEKAARGRGDGTPFEPLDSGTLSIDLVHAEPHFESHAPPPIIAPEPRVKLDTLGWGTTPRAEPTTVWRAPPPLANFIEDARVERLGDTGGVTVMGTHLARVELDGTASPAGFAFRLDALRSYHGAIDPEILTRQSRAGTATSQELAGETFGGIGTPFATMTGRGQLIVGPRSGQRIIAFALEDEVVFFRETALLGFDLSLAYENGRLGLSAASAASGDATPLVQLRGTGTVLVELAADLLSLEVKTGGTTVRKEVVVGWAGRLLPRPLAGGDAPCGQRGLIVFSGEGSVLVSAK